MSEQDSSSSTFNLELTPDHEEDGRTSGIYNAERLIDSEDLAWNWPDTFTNSWEDDSSCSVESGRVITVQYGECTKRIGTDASYEAIKDAIRSAFGLTKRQNFWLEDEHEVVWAVDRAMPQKTYIMHLDKDLVLKVCLSADPNHAPPCDDTVEKELRNQDDFSNFLARRGWVGLKGFRNNQIVTRISHVDPDVVYHGLIG